MKPVAEIYEEVDLKIAIIVKLKNGFGKVGKRKELGNS